MNIPKSTVNIGKEFSFDENEDLTNLLTLDNNITAHFSKANLLFSRVKESITKKLDL